MADVGTAGGGTARTFAKRAAPNNVEWLKVAHAELLPRRAEVSRLRRLVLLDPVRVLLGVEVKLLELPLNALSPHSPVRLWQRRAPGVSVCLQAPAQLRAARVP